MRQKRVRSGMDECSHPILIEEYVDKGPRKVRSQLDSQMMHSWARKRHYESAPPSELATSSTWPTPVPNRRRRKRTVDF